MIVPRSRPSSSSMIPSASFHSRASRWDSSLGTYRYGPLPFSASASWLLATYSATSNSPPATGRPSTSTWRSGRCQPRGRISSVATSSFRRYCLSPSSCSIVPRTASARFTWPSAMLAQVGELESSKSAMKPDGAGVQRVDDHLAVGGTGDLHAAVLHVGGRLGDLPVALAHLAGLVEEVERAAVVQLGLALARLPSSSRRVSSSSRCRRATISRARSVTTSAWRPSRSVFSSALSAMAVPYPAYSASTPTTSTKVSTRYIARQPATSAATKTAGCVRAAATRGSRLPRPAPGRGSRGRSR